MWISSVSMTFLLGFGWWWTWSNTNPQITIAPHPTPPKPNAYDFYVKAKSRMVWSLGKVNETDIRDDLLPDARNPQQFLKTFPLKDRILWLARNKAAIQLIRQGFAYKRQVPNHPDGYLITLSYLFKTECRVRAAQRNWKSAARSALDNIHLGVDSCQSGGIIAMNTSSINLNDGFRDLGAVTECLDAATARKAARELRHLMTKYPAMSESLQNDKRSQQKELMEIFAEGNWRRWMVNLEEYDFDASIAGLNPPPPSIGQTVKEKSNDIRIFLKGMTRCKSNIVRNYTQVADAAIASAQKPYKPFHVRGRDAYSDSVADIYYKVMTRDVKTRTKASMLETALALRAYKLEKGNYPASLDELVPAYLPLVPQDVFANKPLQYKRDGASYKLWSIGPDMKDDGGKPVHDASKSLRQQTFVDFDSIGDFVYGVNR